MTREEKENLLREAVDILIKLDNHLMTSKDNAEFSQWVEDLIENYCEEKQEQTRDEKIIDAIDFAIKVTDSQDDYTMGMRNGMRYVKSLIDGKEPQYEFRRTDEEIKLGIDIGDEVVGIHREEIKTEQ